MRVVYAGELEDNLISIQIGEKENKMVWEGTKDISMLVRELSAPLAPSG